MNKKHSNLKKIVWLICFSFLPFIAGFWLVANTSNWHNTKKTRVSISEKEDEKLETGYALEAAKWYYEQRAYPLGSIPQNWREEAYNHIAQFNHLQLLQKTSQVNSLSWKQLGPGNIGGRVRAIAVSPKDAYTAYIGSVSGGVWKTTNGGTSWFPLNNNMSNLAVCSLVIDPKNSDIIYAGTGEGYTNSDAIQGAGIFKTTNAGTTWSQLSATNDSNFYFVNRLAIDSVTDNIYAATRYGLFMSTDGGDSFNQKVSFSQLGNKGTCLDVVVSYTNPTTIFATFGEFLQSQIWRSIDGGSTFHYNYETPGTGRIELASSPSNPLVTYASFMDISTSEISYLKVTTNGGNTWVDDSVPSPSSEGPGTSYTAQQGWYNNSLAVDPDSDSNLFVAGIDVWKSTDKGKTWTQKTNAYDQTSTLPNVHADIHTMVFAPSNHNVIYLGCDGGVFVSNSRGNTWNAINNNLFITQFYSGAVTPTGSTYYGGAQDNYTLKSDGTTTNWHSILPGDGGVVNVDYNNTDNVYAEFPFFTFVKSTDGGNTFNYAMDGIPQGNQFQTSDRTSFVTPVVMDPNNPNVLVAGTYLVYMTTDGATNWVGITLDLTGDGTYYGNVITALTIAKANSNVIYAACSNGKVWVTKNASASINSVWQEVDKTLPNAWCTSLATEQDNPGIIYATFSGYLDNNKVFKSTNYGQSWTNISGDLPNIPVTCLIVNPNNTENIYIGTDLGIFSTTDSGINWVQDNDGLANVPVSDLDYRSSDNTIFAATHGRGMLSAVLPGATSVSGKDSKIPNSFELSQNYPNPFNPNTTIRYALPEGGNVNLIVYDINGKEITTLVKGYKEAGEYNVVWNGKNNFGQQVASGIYFYSLSAGSLRQTKKLILLK